MEARCVGKQKKTDMRLPFWMNAWSYLAGLIRHAVGKKEMPNIMVFDILGTVKIPRIQRVGAKNIVEEEPEMRGWQKRSLA